MVFVKFHNMNRKKKNSNVKQPQKVSLYKSKQYYNHSSKSSVFFSSFFNLCSDVLSILLKMSVLSSFFLYAVSNNVQVSFSFFFPSFFSLSCTFLFLFLFSFFFLFFFIFFIINCSFNVPFFSTLYLPLSLYLNTITIGSLPSLFNFSL